jgi:hypothetical protein
MITAVDHGADANRIARARISQCGQRNHQFNPSGDRLGRRLIGRSRAAGNTPNIAAIVANPERET